MEPFQEDLKFEAADSVAEDGEALILDIDGFEGPLHLLLELSRQQKVDLARVSILELAEQYLNFIKTAVDLRIELAADYLVMAAWLAYLKSRLILPRADEDDAMPEPDELAAQLAFRLQRLEAMRRARDGLLKLPQTQMNVFVRGNPEGLRSRTSPLWEANLYDIIEAYGASRSRAEIRNIQMPVPAVMSLEEARDRLRRAIMNSGEGNFEDWVALEGLIEREDTLSDDVPDESIKASSLVAGLELAKHGDIELRQVGAFTPIFVRRSQQKGRK